MKHGVRVAVPVPATGRPEARHGGPGYGAPGRHPCPLPGARGLPGPPPR